MKGCESMKVIVEENRLLPKRGKLIFTSRGLNSRVGTALIAQALEEKNLSEKTILLISVPEYEIDELLIKSCEKIGFSRQNIFLSSQSIFTWQRFDILYCTEGNTFLIADYMRKNGLDNVVRENVANGSIYIGCSAGAILSGTDFELALDFDSNSRIKMTDFRGLGLFDGAIIPHYEDEELEKYIQYTEKYRIQRYKRIYSVGNEDVLVMC